MSIGKLKGKHLLAMGKRFGIKGEAVVTAIESLGKQLPKALEAVEKSPIGTPLLRKKLIEKMEKRWKGSFALTG